MAASFRKEFFRINMLYRSSKYTRRRQYSNGKHPKPVKFAECPDRVFSGIQPTGVPHIGNYLGAIKYWVDLQHTYPDILYSIVDMHSITMPQDPVMLRKNIKDMVLCLVACGIDVEKVTLFLQSDIAEHAGLSWIFTSLVHLGRLSVLPQWKTKADSVREAGVALMTYPVLQSADILLYKANIVPVGEDQLMHVELTTDIARMFNNRFGIYFPKPQALLGDIKRVKSLREPGKKMSKSDKDTKSCILLTDSHSEIRKKFKKAITDFTSAVTYDPDSRPGVSNLIDIHSAFTGLTPHEICTQCKGLETAQYKLVVADAVSEKLKPIQDEIERLKQDEGFIEQILSKGAHAARNIAEKNYDEIKHLVGFR